MCIFICFNVCLFYTYITGDLILVALHKKKKREGVLRRTLAMSFFFLFRLYVTLNREGINTSGVRK
jgi:amino acid permease